MRQERMKVLELLEAGKITAAEAKDLLESVKSKDPGNIFAIDEETRENVEDKLNQISSHVDNFTRDFGNRVQEVYKDFEPKIKKASQTVLEKTASVFDEISKSLNESLESARNSINSADNSGNVPPQPYKEDDSAGNGPRPE